MQYAASFVGWSNTGKTSLISRIVQVLSARGTHVGALKKGHSAPSFEQHGKDTDLFFQNGAERVGYLSEHGGFIRFSTPPPVDQLGPLFSSCEILLLEGIYIPGVPCFELIHSVEHIPDTKFPPEQLTGYIISDPHQQADTYITQTYDQVYNREQRPILPASQPELIIKHLEELWNAESASK